MSCTCKKSHTVTQKQEFPPISLKTMKDNYYRVIGDLIDNNRSKAVTPLDEILMTQKWVSSIIRRIVFFKQSNIFVVDQTSLENMSEIIDKYDVIPNNLKSRNVSSTHSLFLKPKRLNEPIKKIIPLQESFDIVLQAHKSTDHGNSENIMEWLKHDFKLLSEKCADAIISVCVTCIEAKSKGYIGAAEIINMTSCPDTLFHYILIYQDKNSGFVQLRPLTRANEMEISMELIKIFMDLGPPQILEVYQSSYFGYVEMNVNNACSPFKTNFVHKPATKSLIPNIINTVMNSSVSSGPLNWAIGCHMVQWNINTTNDDSKTTPYEQFFGRKPNVPTTFAPLQDPSLHTEEDLGVFIDNDIKTEHETIPSDEDDTLSETTSALIIRDHENSARFQGPEASYSLRVDDTINKICNECNLEILTTIFKCKRCKNGIHLYCGDKNKEFSSTPEENTTKFQVMCFTCTKIEDKIAELKRKAEEFDEQIRIIKTLKK